MTWFSDEAERHETVEDSVRELPPHGRFFHLMATPLLLASNYNSLYLTTKSEEDRREIAEAKRRFYEVLEGFKQDDFLFECDPPKHIREVINHMLTFKIENWEDFNTIEGLITYYESLKK